VNPRIGSFFFIGALLVDVELEPDAPFEADRCGSCTRCLDACPTDAFVDERVLDARKCISYLTIEAKGGIPDDFRNRIGELVYGCDICQEVCPWNIRFAQELAEDAFRPRDVFNNRSALQLGRKLLAMSEEAYRQTFKGSPMKRAKRRGLARNAAVVIGNLGNESDFPLLQTVRASSEPMLSEHSDWAMRRIVARTKTIATPE